MVLVLALVACVGNRCPHPRVYAPKSSKPASCHAIVPQVFGSSRGVFTNTSNVNANLGLGTLIHACSSRPKCELQLVVNGHCKFDIARSCLVLRQSIRRRDAFDGGNADRLLFGVHM